MSDFREIQKRAHPKTNTLLLAIIMMLILILSIQIWLLYSALNNALDEHRDIAIPAFIGSVLLFLTGLWLLKYLPDYRKQADRDHTGENKYQ